MPDDRTLVRVAVVTVGTGFVFKGHVIGITDPHLAEFHDRIPMRCAEWVSDMFKVEADELADLIAARSITDDQYSAALRDLTQHLIEIEAVGEDASLSEIIEVFRSGDIGGSEADPRITERKYRPSFPTSFRATNVRKDFFPLLSITAVDPKTDEPVKLGTEKGRKATADAIARAAAIEERRAKEAERAELEARRAEAEAAKAQKSKPRPG